MALLEAKGDRCHAHPSREIQLKALIRRRYAARLGDPARASGARSRAEEAGYGSKALAGIPAAIIDGWSGCGALAPVVTVGTSEIVVDLGCGTGVDTWLIASAEQSPETVIAVDLTPEVLADLRKAAQSIRTCTILSVAGDLESLPLGENCCDLVVSNGAFSLAIDQPKAYSEALRILRPGGRLRAFDLVSETELPPDILTDPMGHGTSLGGIRSQENLRGMIEAAGFVDVSVGNQHPFPPAISVEIRARKPP